MPAIRQPGVSCRLSASISTTAPWPAAASAAIRQVVARERELVVQRHRLDPLADERVEPRAADGRGELERNRHVVEELRAPARVGRQPAVAGGGVATVEVQQHQLQRCVGNCGADVAGLDVAVPVHLDGAETGSASRREPVEQRQLTEQQRHVGAEPAHRRRRLRVRRRAA